MERIRSQLSATGISDSGLQLGNPYSGSKKNKETANEKEIRFDLDFIIISVIFACREMKSKLAKLENNANKQKPVVTPAGKTTKPPPKSKVLAGKLSRTCRNWNLGLW